MALDSHVWAPATPMPMAESALYRQRLEVIAEKRRLQEAIRAAQRELEEEKLRVQRLKRKSLRDRWLMDGAAEEPEDPPTPESQAQARIQNLEDSLFTLQAQLQLLQSASTGALHRPVSRSTRRRQGQRPLSQPSVEPVPAGQADRDKRSSLPAELAGVPPECPAEPGQVPRAAGVSSEANGPRLGPSPVPAPEGAVAEGAGDEDPRGGIVEVVWEGPRAAEDGAAEPTCAELEAKVEAMVLEAIGERLDTSGPELPAWARDDRAIVEVVWEGLGGDLVGEQGGAPRAVQPSSPMLPEGSRRGSPDGAGQGSRGGEDSAFIWVERVTVSEDWEELGLEGAEGSRGSGQEPGHGGGAVSWELERRWAEEEAHEGSENVPEVDAGRGEGPRPAEGREEEEGPPGAGREGGEETPGAEGTGEEGRAEAVGGSKGAPGGEGDKATLQGEQGGEELVQAAREGGEESLKAQRDRGEESPKAGREGGEESPKVGREGGEESPKAGREGGKESPKVGREGGEESPKAGREGGEESPKAGREGGEESPKVGREGGEESPKAGREGGEESPKAGREGGEESSKEGREGGEESPKAGREGGEESSKESRERDEESPKVDREGGEELPKAGREGGEESMKAEKQGEEEVQQSEETREAGREARAEQSRTPGGPEGRAGATAGAREEPKQEEAQPPQKMEDCLEVAAASQKPQPSAEGPSPSGNATPLLEGTPAPAQQPPECQPLLQVEGPRTDPSAHPVPSYAPARQPPPSAAAPEGSEASAPKQKTCQCCAVM